MNMHLQLVKIRDRSWQIQACSALSGEGIKVCSGRIIHTFKAKKTTDFAGWDGVDLEKYQEWIRKVGSIQLMIWHFGNDNYLYLLA
jgi:hypothetical protein